MGKVLFIIIMFMIKASELAACIGMHKFVPVNKSIVTIWDRTDHIGYEDAMRRYLSKTIPPEPDVSIPPIHFVVPKELQERVNSIILSDNHIPEVDKLISEQTDKDSKRELKSFIFRKRGQLAENGDIIKAEKTMNKSIKGRNKFYERWFSLDTDSELDPYIRHSLSRDKFLLCGQIDGITDDNVLIESKNRQYKLFTHVPIYENVQVHAYMYLTGIHTCKLIQTYRDKTDIKMIQFDEEFWTDVKAKMIAFAHRMSTLLDNEDEQDTFRGIKK